MALISCPECKTEVSDTAKACPKCGARVKPARKAWFWLASLMGFAAVSVGAMVVYQANDPDARAKADAREAYEGCMKEFNDPLTPPFFKNSLRPICAKFRDDFIARYKVNP